MGNKQVKRISQAGKISLHASKFKQKLKKVGKKYKTEAEGLWI